MLLTYFNVKAEDTKIYDIITFEKYKSKYMCIIPAQKFAVAIKLLFIS